MYDRKSRMFPRHCAASRACPGHTRRISSGRGFFTRIVSKFGYMQNFCEITISDPRDSRSSVFDDTRSTNAFNSGSLSYSSINKILSVFLTKNRKLLLPRQCSGNTSTGFSPRISNVRCTMKVFPTPEAPHTNTFLHSRTHCLRRSMFSSCKQSDVASDATFFSSTNLMKDSIHDEFLKQSIDLLNESNALQDLVIKPLKRRIFPFVAVAGLVNLLILVLLFYILSQLSHLKSVPLQ
ncbi:hypothetical protein DSLPV1_018 [Dishui lake phycodnavirus 1]|uniref:hypothetical protein n=1 Tax=Dishui lake phycodnavirus 1 TaxID=2079134 RepID=UPI000CD684A9|nr:hypothetical protein C5Y57_gp018 [Dishui lake phycodnavirus 1]AUT18989.1 hypothetical protein DSLPV1_018 [Dishui lake phycodnavirus 1]